jgi:hypothetical protein
LSSMLMIKSQFFFSVEIILEKISNLYLYLHTNKRREIYLCICIWEKKVNLFLEEC